MVSKRKVYESLMDMRIIFGDRGIIYFILILYLIIK